jgi:two-component system NtrC family sensor kinase
MSARLLDFDETLGGPEDVPLNEAIDRKLLPFRGAPAGRAIDIATAYDPAAGSVRCPPPGLLRVFSSVVTNAVKSMPSGGRLGVTTHIGTEDIRVVFEDTGCGIPQENIDKIFDPFFTTWDEAGGHGLTVARKITEGWGGKVTVSSRVHSGTSVTVTFPIPAE